MIPEAEILLICARVSLTPERRTRLDELLAQSPDWRRLIGLAERHGLLPLLAHHLVASAPASVPAGFRDELHGRVSAIVGRNLMMTSELIRVVRRLEAREIPALPYKGPVLAVAAYGSLALRSFDDLDLLVPRRHVREAARLLLEDGYQPVYRLTPAQEAAYFRTQCEYIVERDNVRVELHWEIVPPYFSWPFDLEGLWGRAEPAVLAGATLRTLSVEDLLLVLCAHGSKHCWDRLEWIASFAEIVRRSASADWTRVRDGARRAGASRMLALSLALVRDLMEVELPPHAREPVERDPTARSLAHEVGRRILSGDAGMLDRPREVRFHLRARERLRDRTRYVLRLATTQTLGDWDLVDLPRGVDGLYRVIRPVRLLRKFGLRAISRSLHALSGASRAPDGDPARGTGLTPPEGRR
ncbi:MAG TPA: nucleotidyltransferase family protein [Methylomirabilota bacterium]|nr:nucleotidyltransferase family protein [Methylomirabilota bacterium]